MLLQRLDNQYRWAAPQMTEPPSTQARRMWYDTVGHFHVPALRCACESFGADRLLLGTDFPYLSGDGYRRSVAYIEDAGLSTSEAHRILDTNAASCYNWRGGKQCAPSNLASPLRQTSQT